MFYESGKLIIKTLEKEKLHFIKKKLTELTKEPWEVLIEEGDEAQSLFKQEEDRKKELLQELLQDPIIQKLLAKFPEAKIEIN